MKTSQCKKISYINKVDRLASAYVFLYAILENQAMHI